MPGCSAMESSSRPYSFGDKPRPSAWSWTIRSLISGPAGPDCALAALAIAGNAVAKRNLRRPISMGRLLIPAGSCTSASHCPSGDTHAICTNRHYTLSVSEGPQCRCLRLWLGRRSGPVKNPTRTRGCHRTAFEHDRTVDDHDWNALGILLRIIQCSGVAHACRIEHDDIRFHAFPDGPTIVEPEPPRR